MKKERVMNNEGPVIVSNSFTTALGISNRFFERLPHWA
jgi:hypothetical protein